MNYPLISEYIESIKSPEDNFDQLRHLIPVLDDEGNPIMSSGNFAVVFKMTDGKKNYAIKCFTKEQEGRLDAYQKICQHLNQVKSDYLVHIEFFQNELFVDTNQTDETEFPVLLMDWVEGKTLDLYIKQLINKEWKFVNSTQHLRSQVLYLALDFLDFAHWMSLQEIAHGDIKPDNIMITKKGLVLIDYDGMFVPQMIGQKSRELGSPNYRHPLRNINSYDSSIDNFSLSVIAFSLVAITINKNVYNNDFEDALVLSDKDFGELNNPKLFERIGIVLHDRICSTLFSSIMMQIANPVAKIDFDSLFSLNSYIYNRPPIYLPFKVEENAFLLYNTDKGQCISHDIFSDIYIVNDNHNESSMIVSKGGKIDYFSINDLENRTISVTEYILLEERLKNCKPNSYALISNKSNIDHLQWYNFIKPITSSIFLAENEDGFWGIIYENQVLLAFLYKSITPVSINNKIFFISENKKGELGLYKLANEKTIIKIIDKKINSKHWHYKNGASAPANLIIFYDGTWKGYDLEQECFVLLPSHLKRIKSYSEQILCVETWDSDGGFKLYSTDSESYINNNIYKSVGTSNQDLHPFKRGFAICETDTYKNVIVSTNGEIFVIPYGASRLRRGGDYIFFDDIVVQNFTNDRRCDIEITIFDNRTKQIFSFIYQWDSYGIRAISIKDDQYVSISTHNMKYNYTQNLALLDFSGKSVDIKITQNVDELKNSSICIDEELILEHIVRNKFVNKKFIPNIEKYEGIDCIIKNGYAIINGITDVDPEFGVSTELIGYADANRCYWEINM